MMTQFKLSACTLLCTTLAAMFMPVAAQAASNQVDLAQLQRQVRELQDIEAIRQLKFRYFRAIDSADLKLLDSLLTDDVEVRFIGGTYDWKLKGKTEYVEAVGRNFNSQMVTEHNGNHPEITILSETEAKGTWYLHDNFYNLMSMSFTTGSAFYHDQYRKVDGEWKIANTRYVRHYEIVTPLKEKPNITVHYLGQHGRVVERDCHTDALCRDAE